MKSKHKTLKIATIAQARVGLLYAECFCFFFFPCSPPTPATGSNSQPPDSDRESNKARSGCQRGGVKEVLGVTYVALNCSPSVLPSYSWNVSLIVPLKSHFLHREFQISIMMLADLQRVSGLTLHL